MKFEITKYERDPSVELLYGDPDAHFWLLYTQAIEYSPTDKGAIVRAYHFIAVAAGQNIDEARLGLNTFTLANYQNRGTSYLSDAKNKPKHYSEGGVFGFIYGDGEWAEVEETKQKQLRLTRVALLTPWGREVAEQKGILVETALDRLKRFAERELQLSAEKIFIG